jgi:hypothetical protein
LILIVLIYITLRKEKKERFYEYNIKIKKNCDLMKAVVDGITYDGNYSCIINGKKRIVWPRFKNAKIEFKRDKIIFYDYIKSPDTPLISFQYDINDDFKIQIPKIYSKLNPIYGTPG